MRFNLSRSFSISLLLGVSASLLLSFSASAASTWNDKPTWATDSGNSAPQHRRPANQVRDNISNANITPFSPGSSNFALDLGQVFLMGDLASKYEDSIGAQMHYTYGVSDMFGFDASLGHSSHSEGKYSMTTLLTGLRTNLSWYDKVIPYFIVGLGFYKPSYEITPTSSVGATLFGLHAGPGVDLQLTRELFFGAALSFHDVFGATRMTEVGPKDIGGTYTTFLLHAGVTF
ncbi:MAG: hypothetical protein H7222_03530 [Methylotenera sp.]|nr:hypothetical protein [Oligoflexia bacterium]